MRGLIEKRRLRKRVTEKRASVIRGGLGLLTIRTQDEVAEIMGITRQAVQQIERKALWKLRMRLREHNLFNEDKT